MFVGFLGVVTFLAWEEHVVSAWEQVQSEAHLGWVGL